MIFCDWLLSFNIMFPRLIHVIPYISTSFLFIAEYSIAWMNYTLFINSLMDEHLGCLVLGFYKCASMHFCL